MINTDTRNYEAELRVAENQLVLVRDSIECAYQEHPIDHSLLDNLEEREENLQAQIEWLKFRGKQAAQRAIDFPPYERPALFGTF